MSIISTLRRQKFLSAGLLLATLVVGILIGTVINTDVSADQGKAITDATPLVIPKPVKLENQFSKLAKRLESAVVNITTDYLPEEKAGAGQDPHENLDLFRRFFGGPGMPQQPRRRHATGSGFIVDPKGFIITNHHVIEHADAIKVKLMDDQTEHKAKLIGFDIETDLAVIKIDVDHPLQAIEIGNSDATQVGDWAIAIGSPFGLESTMTVGIVSAKGRDIGTQQFQRFIQTDAAINRGNSGGPLVNIRGQVIGINTMIATSSGGSQGIGFALPINMATKVYNQITKYGRVTRGSIGVSFNRDEDPDLLAAMGQDHGVVVTTVQKEGPADRAGVKVEDIIIAMNGTPVKNGDDLVARVADTPVGEKATLTVDRGGKKIDLPVIVADRAEVWKNDPRFAFYRNEKEGAAPEGQEAKFGIYVQNLTPREKEKSGLENGGVKVTRVEMGGFGEENGLREGDVILSINRHPVTSVTDIKTIQETLKSGDAVALRVARPGPTGNGREIQYRPFYIAGKLP